MKSKKTTMEELCDQLQESSISWCGAGGGMEKSSTLTPAQGEALDVILVVPSDDNTAPCCSDFLVQFPDSNISNCSVNVSINGSTISGMEMKMTKKGTVSFVIGESLKPPSNTLQELLKFTSKGKNSIRYSLFDNQQILATAHASLYVWSVDTHVIVCDLDGTVTKSNARGVLDTMVLESYTHAHDGVCEFLTNLVEMEERLQVLYLTSRPLSYATSTRKFLAGLQQEQQTCTHRLPKGPLFMHPGTLKSVLMSELVTKDVHIYKSDTLLRSVVLVFAAAGRTSNVLVAGFGNTLADCVAYEMAGISRNNIYMIDTSSNISASLLLI